MPLPFRQQHRLHLLSRAATVSLCALTLSLLTGCALWPSLSPRPDLQPWEARPTPPVPNTANPNAAPGRGWDLHHPSLRFGGLSGMTVPALLPTDPPDRLPVLAVSDRGALVRFFLRPDGSPDPVLLPVVTPLTGTDGQTLLKNQDRDAEEIVRLADGTLLVSFEQDHRLWAYPPDLSSPPESVPLPGGFGKPPHNRGIEAMALHPDGRLLLVLEEHATAPEHTGQIRAWVGTPAPESPLTYSWSPRWIAGEDGFDVSGASILPSGGVLLLERGWSFPLTFHTRIRRIDARVWNNSVGGSPEPLDGPVVFRLSTPELQDNYESLVVLPSPSGADMDRHALILSDNNFLNAQKTLLLDIGPLADLDGSQR